MPIKATIVAYALSVQYSKNTAIVAYTGLRVNNPKTLGLQHKLVISQSTVIKQR